MGLRDESLLRVSAHEEGINLWLEPWGECFPVAPHTSVEIVMRGTARQGPEITRLSDGIAVWVPEGFEVWLFQDSVELSPVPGGRGTRAVNVVPEFPSPNVT